MTMRRSLLFFIIILGIQINIFAQQPLSLHLQHKVLQKQEITIEGDDTNASDHFRLMLEVKWDSLENKIYLKFDRNTISDGPNLKLCFSQLKNAELIKNVKNCNSGSKMLWRGKNAKNIKQLDYFLRSDDIKLEFEDCYEFVSNNNVSKDFSFSIKEKRASSIHIDLNNLYVLRDQKRPWYTFSKRNMKIEYRVKPIELKLILEYPPIDPCNESDKILFDIKSKIVRLEKIKAEITQLKIRQNCTSLKSKQDQTKQNFQEKYIEWNNHSKCNEVSEAIVKYKQIREDILREQCIMRPCSVDFSKINAPLMNLQIDILRKTKNGESVEKERTEYFSIKEDTDKKITSDCPRNQVDNYRAICKNIERALNK